MRISPKTDQNSSYKPYWNYNLQYLMIKTELFTANSISSKTLNRFIPYAFNFLLHKQI